MGKDRRKGHPLRLDPEAKSASSQLPAFLARPEGSPVYHGFPIVPETETDGWVYGTITDFEVDTPQHEGDGFVVAPDGTRAGIAWATDTPDFYEICAPDDQRWGVYGVRFHKAVETLDDLVENFRAVLPALQQRYQEICKGRG